MTGKEWVGLFIESLFELKDEANDPKYEKDNNANSLWTEFIINKVIKEKLGEKLDCSVVCRDKNSRENSGEYLNIDAMLFYNSDYNNPLYNEIKDKKSYDVWVLPAAVVEHESEGSKEEKIAFCLWKLLCIRSKLRVLVCYHKESNRIRKFLEDTIKYGKLVNGLTDDELFVIIGDSSKDKLPWKERKDIKEYFSIFQWKNNRLEEFIE